ncbi:chaplin [Streptacidiphilus sp. MAP5-3]|uniref:chaplin n=1 Tax=unclassified Streptacidiphilus TaxID=2643834 RepID=UPI003519826A
MATGSVLASTAGYAAGYAFADTGATGASSDSPGALSGNTVQVPVSVPVNACGNTVNVVGLLNPAYGNHCANDSVRSVREGGDDGGGTTGGGSTAKGGAHGSPGVGSGNSVQVPVSIPLNLCGNTVNAPGAGNPAYGNDCGNHSSATGGDNRGGGGVPTSSPSCACSSPAGGGSTGGEQPPPPNSGTTAAPSGHRISPPPPAGEVLAETGGGGDALLLAGGGVLLAAGGAVIYRKARRQPSR